MNTHPLVCSILSIAVLLLLCMVQDCNSASTHGAGGGNLAVNSLVFDQSQNGNRPGAIKNTAGAAPGYSGPGAGYRHSAQVFKGDQNSANGTVMQWTTYTDATFGFSFSYPDIYTILAERENLATIAPELIGRCRLLEPVLANSEFAELEPPKFSVEIYANPAGQSVQGWIQKHAPGGDLERFSVDNKNCAQVTLHTLLAPNQFVFCDHGGKIYKFTPMGAKSQEILHSFKFGS